MKFRKILSWTMIVAILSALVVGCSFDNRPKIELVVKGRSMEPTLYNGEYGYSYGYDSDSPDPERGDLIAFNMTNKSTGETDTWIKRVIALPGETIQGLHGIVYVDGVALDESEYISEEFAEESLAEFNKEAGYENDYVNEYKYFTSDFGPVKLSSGQYFVMGDNRIRSRDSRHIGPINNYEILGVGFEKKEK